MPNSNASAYLSASEANGRCVRLPTVAITTAPRRHSRFRVTPAFAKVTSTPLFSPPANVRHRIRWVTKTVRCATMRNDELRNLAGSRTQKDADIWRIRYGTSKTEVPSVRFAVLGLVLKP